MRQRVAEYIRPAFRAVSFRFAQLRHGCPVAYLLQLQHYRLTARVSEVWGVEGVGCFPAHRLRHSRRKACALFVRTNAFLVAITSAFPPRFRLAPISCPSHIAALSAFRLRSKCR